MKLLTKLKRFATRSNAVKAVAIGVFMLGGVMAVQTANTSAATGCDALGVGNRRFTNSTNNTAYTIKNGKATVKFKVSGHNCKLPVSTFFSECRRPLLTMRYKVRLAGHPIYWIRQVRDRALHCAVRRGAGRFPVDRCRGLLDISSKPLTRHHGFDHSAFDR